MTIVRKWEDNVKFPFTEKAGGRSKLQHIAIIMDGNRRWAKARGLPIDLGHYRGAEAARRTIRAAAEIGIPYLTLFGFSSENWNRPQGEIDELMQLLRKYLQREIKPLFKANVQLRIIGDRTKLEPDVIAEIENAELMTAGNNGLKLAIAFSYGSRNEIAQAARKIAEEVLSGALSIDAVSEVNFDKYLLTSDMPDPDLVIRTSGEKRVSNFLLWQSAYAEFIFLDKLWPDFEKQDLLIAIDEYMKRDRRYGAIS